MGNVILIVLDSVGIGALPDAHLYNDQGSATLQHTLDSVDDIYLPNLENIGLGKIAELRGISPKKYTYKTGYGKMQSSSMGKDTTTGHWELMGVLLETPMKTFPQGFPKDVMDEFVRETGYDFIGNVTASGTEIIRKLGREHQETKKVIVYTSSDSVFQIAAHEETVPLDELYNICKAARKICDKYSISRVIARPFETDSQGHFVRTNNRKDYSLLPPHETALDKLQQAGIQNIGIGKISDIFAGQGLDLSFPSKGNQACIESTLEQMAERNRSFIFTNLVDFDMVYGHRRDPQGYYNCLKEFDDALPKILSAMKDDDLLLMTADHGTDPTFKGTDHTREYVPLIAYSKETKKAISLGIRTSFADIGKTVCDYFNVKTDLKGTSFLKDIM